MPSTVPTDLARQTGPKVPTGIVPNVLTDLGAQNLQKRLGVSGKTGRRSGGA